MARKTRLTKAAVKIGTTVGRAERTARAVGRAAEVTRDEIRELTEKIEALARELKQATKRLKRSLR